MKHIDLGAKIADLEQVIFSMRTDAEYDRWCEDDNNLKFLRELHLRIEKGCNDTTEQEYALNMVSDWIAQLEKRLDGKKVDKAQVTGKSAAFDYNRFFACISFLCGNNQVPQATQTAYRDNKDNILLIQDHIGKYSPLVISSNYSTLSIVEMAEAYAGEAGKLPEQQPAAFEILRELVDLKKMSDAGEKVNEYLERKPKVWEAAFRLIDGSAQSDVSGEQKGGAK